MLGRFGLPRRCPSSTPTRQRAPEGRDRQAGRARARGQQVCVDKLLRGDDAALKALGIDDARARKWVQGVRPGGDREDLLAFIGYYESPFDPRPMQQCIADARPRYLEIFLEKFGNNATRCEAMADKIAQSRFPVTGAQLQHFLQRFDGKPGDAQVHCDELLARVTTAVAADEHKAPTCGAKARASAKSATCTCRAQGRARQGARAGARDHGRGG